MIPALKPRLIVVWLFLVGATLVSWSLGRGALASEAAAATVLAIALIKVRFVVMEFMELRLAPLPFRLAFDFWCLALWGALVVLPSLVAG